jgi:hypothetical protein
MGQGRVSIVDTTAYAFEDQVHIGVHLLLHLGDTAHATLPYSSNSKYVLRLQQEANASMKAYATETVIHLRQRSFVAPMPSGIQTRFN